MEETHTRPPPLANTITHANNLAANAVDYGHGLRHAYRNATSIITYLGSPAKSTMASVMTDSHSKTSPSTPAHATDIHDATSTLTGLSSPTKNPNTPDHNTNTYFDAGGPHDNLHAIRTRATAHYGVDVIQP